MFIASMSDRFLDDPWMKAALEKFSSAVNIDIIGGGEPLLNPYFFELVKLGKSYDMSVKTFSNGTIIDQFQDQLLESDQRGFRQLPGGIRSVCR